MTASVSSAALTRAELEHAAPRTVRMAVREGRWTTNTKRLALGFHQANVTILPKHLAFDFMRFCQRNPRALPILDVTDPGDPVPRIAAPDADIRVDIPSYCIYRDGKLVDRVRDLRDQQPVDRPGPTRRRNSLPPFGPGGRVSRPVSFHFDVPACGGVP